MKWKALAVARDKDVVRLIRENDGLRAANARAVDRAAALTIELEAARAEIARLKKRP